MTRHILGFYNDFSDSEGIIDPANAVSAQVPSDDQHLKRKDRVKHRKKKGISKLPKLTLINLDQEGEIVECQLETSAQSTVSFKFSRIVDSPAEIAQNLVSSQCRAE